MEGGGDTEKEEQGSRERAALGVGVGFGECKHTLGMIEIGNCMPIPGKAYRSNHINISEQAITRTRIRSCSTMPFILLSGLDSASCPMLRLLDA